MDEPHGPSPYDAPKAALGSPGPSSTTGRVVLGIGLILVSSLIFMVGVWLALDPVSDEWGYWAAVAVIALMGAGGFRSGWKLGAAQPAGYSWLAIPIGAVLVYLIPKLL